jgi:hypothetical protein
LGSDGIGDTHYAIDTANIDNYPLMDTWTPPDIAATNLAVSKSFIGQKYTINITGTVANQGKKVEGFNVSIMANSTLIASVSIILVMEASASVPVSWNTSGFTYGNYTVTEYIEPLPSEVELSNNNFTGSTIRVTIPGDVDGDFRVKPQDLNTLLTSFGAPLSGKPFNPSCNIDNNGYIGPIDLNILLSHFGQHYP